ncbi:hypothetical protein A2U01_0033822 [Trifolium medium]|uniref:Uncharacterized protein n=1 Tax=Trifolium medium TaxID=97028 RepID=A0A392PP84_9FABA|nr:hypothetical protein [Trifolium medium]
MGDEKAYVERPIAKENRVQHDFEPKHLEHLEMHSSMDKTQHNSHNNTAGTFIHGMESNDTVNVESQSTSNGDGHTAMAQRSGDNSVGITHDITMHLN